MDKVREDAQRSVLLSCQVVLDFGLKHNNLLCTTTAKQPERTPTLGLIRDVTPVLAALAAFFLPLLRPEGARGCVSSLYSSMGYGNNKL